MIFGILSLCNFLIFSTTSSQERKKIIDKFSLIYPLFFSFRSSAVNIHCNLSPGKNNNDSDKCPVDGSKKNPISTEVFFGGGRRKEKQSHTHTPIDVFFFINYDICLEALRFVGLSFWINFRSLNISFATST